MIAETQAFVLVAVVLLASVGTGVVVPWISRQIMSLVLHDLRDRLYGFGDSPGFRDTLVYRDTEFLVCHAIRVAREGDPEQIARFADAILRPTREASAPATDRAETYGKEVAQHGDGVDGVLGLHGALLVTIAGYTLLRSPQAMLLTALLLPIMAIVLLVLVLREAGGPLHRLARTVDGAGQWTGPQASEV